MKFNEDILNKNPLKKVNFTENLKQNYFCHRLKQVKITTTKIN